MSADTAGISKQRLEALSDGIYAIALTLLVLDLKLPPLPVHLTDAALRAALFELAPKLFTWLLSFWIIALYWLAQQRLYSYCKSVDSTLVWIELAQLSLISAFPFSNALMGEYGRYETAAVLYGVHLLAIACLSALRTRHFTRSRDRHGSPISPEMVRQWRRRSCFLVASALATTLLGFVIPGWNTLAMLPSALLTRIRHSEGPA